MSGIGLPSVPQRLDASKTGPWVPNFLMGKLSMMLALPLITCGRLLLDIRIFVYDGMKET